MKRTISAMVGQGSVNHNSRAFNAKNTDRSRSHLNITYCHENIKTVFHELFDEALKRYNDKQTRADRKIEDYYEKIRSSKQEKPFHEIILQVGNKDDMSAEGEDGQLAAAVLDEYMRGFQERNPQLRVFSAHLHMDEATPHLHIDFIPFTSGSKRGLSTRVSLKQALADQGITGEGRSLTERDLWVQKEKEALAEMMLEHGIEWEQKGEHREHLSVLEYKREMRTQELAELTEQTQEKAAEAAALDKQIEKTKQQKVNIESIDKIEVKPVMLSPSRVSLEKTDYETLSTAAKKYYAQEKKEFKLQKLLDAANKMIEELKSKIKSLIAENSSLRDELSEYKSVRNRLNSANLEQENERLQRKVRTYEEVISDNKLWHLFGKVRGKTHTRNDARCSLDSTVLYIVSSLVKGLIKDVRDGISDVDQIFVLTHNVFFHKETAFIDRRTEICNDIHYWTISKDNNISTIKSHERNNPIKTSYELLWQELKDGSNTSRITTQNVMRRILENYFSMLRKTKDDTIENSFVTIEEKTICRSLLSWINDGSHSIPDDLYIDSYTDSIGRYKQIFRDIFINMGHEAHYNMMMGISK